MEKKQRFCSEVDLEPVALIQAWPTLSQQTLQQQIRLLVG